MYARITTFTMDPAREAEVLGQLDDIKARVQAIPGIVASYNSWRSSDGHGVTAAIYESKEAMDAAVGAIQALWSGMAEYMTSAPRVETYENVRDMLS